MNYQEAKEIRQTRLRDLISENLVSGDTNIKESFKKAISDKSKAKVKGIKETFDPLNIAKFLTGGSKLGPALLGRLTGRSQEDINYFTDTPNKKVNKVDEKETPILGILNKIYTFMNKNYQDDIRRRELENNYLEEKALEEKKRHDLLLKTLKDLMKRIASPRKAEKEKEPEPESGNGIFDSLRDIIGKRVAKALVAVGAGAAAEKVGKKVLEKGVEKSIGKTAEKVTGEVAKEVTGKAAEKGVAKTAEKITGEVAKEVGKEAAEKATKEKIEKVVSGKLSKFIFSSTAKKIPIAGVIIGGIFGLKKLYEGDTVGAGMEVASGAAGTIPIAGTAASLGIDAAGLARDVYKEVYDKFPEEEPEVAKQRMQQIATIIEQIVKSKTASDKDKAETKDKKDVKDVPLKEIPKENATTTLATTDSKSGDSTSPLSASESKVGNTTTPLTASESKSSSVSSPQTMTDILKGDDTTDLVKSGAIKNATATQMSTPVPSITKSDNPSYMSVDNTKQTSLKLNQEEKTPVGLPLQETINQNQNLNIENSNIKNTSKPNQINITNPAPQDKKSSIISQYIFPVRNPEETFRNMIFNSTRVV